MFLKFLKNYFLKNFNTDKKLDEMTMRKYEKIRENIMIMNQMNSKRVEKPTEETPGPDYYEPNYNQVENNGFAVKKNLK